MGMVESIIQGGDGAVAGYKITTMKGITQFVEVQSDRHRYLVVSESMLCAMNMFMASVK